MPVFFTDEDIKALLLEPKVWPADYISKMQMKPKMGHKEGELAITGKSGSQFTLILRQSKFNPLVFSVILAFKIPNNSQPFRLCRYNGSHSHRNKLEAVTIEGCHIHKATARYQGSGLREDSFAVATTRYNDIHGAISCMVADCAFILPPYAQTKLFDGEFSS